MTDEIHKPFLSIITVTLNDADNLLKTIHSIKGQKFDDLELIVIDGKSNDHTCKIIETNLDIIKKWQSEKDGGIYQAMNKGIDLAEGEFTLFLNSGDTFTEPDVLSEAYKEINKSEADIFYTNYKVGNEKINQNLSLNYLFRKMICHQTIFYNTSNLKLNKYNENMRFASDYEHLIRNFSQLTHKKIDITLVNYDANGISSNPKNYSKIWSERLVALRHANINPVMKFSMRCYAFLAMTVRKKK